MGNTTLITDWLNRTPGIPFDLAKPVLDSAGEPVSPPQAESTDAIVIVAPWGSPDPELTTSQKEQIIDLAIEGFIKYYHPAIWYILYGGWRPAGYTPSTSTITPEEVATHTVEFAGTGTEQIEEMLAASTSKYGQPTDLWELAEYLREQDAPDPPVSPDPLIIAANIDHNVRSALLIEDVRKPDRPGSRLRVLVAAKPGWASMKTGNFPAHGPYPQFPEPSYNQALNFWNEQQNIIPWNDSATPGRALTFTWPKVNEQLQTIKTLFTKYHNQARRFDGQVVPGINFENQFRALEGVVGRIGELLSLNGYAIPSKPDDEITVYINNNYQITGIEYFQPTESLNTQPVKVGYLPYSIVEPFADFQSIVYLSHWDSLLGLIAKPPGRQYEVFINFIEGYANSHLRTYEINYCGPAHSPLARQEIEAANDLLIFGPGTGQLLKQAGYMSPGDDTMHLSFPGLSLQKHVLQDPTNRGLILNDQFAKQEKKAEDVVESVTKFLKDIKNSEEMSIIKDVLQKVGIDKLIIEAIRCLTLNSSYNPSGLVSDIKDLVSTGSELFAGRKRPMSFDFPEITVEVPVFSITGGLQEAIKKVIIEALLGAAASLVEALMEMIKEACKRDDPDADDHGVIDLSDMFEVNPSPNKMDQAGPLLGLPHGLNVCFGTYNIPDAVGMKYLADVSAILTPTEICQLLRGTPVDEAVEAILEFNLLYEEPPIPDNLNTSSIVISFFGCLGDMVDIESICQTLVEEMIPAVDDLCITEEQLLSAVDTFNLNNLLDMLENGIVVDIPEINLTCPTEPGYMPNPLVDRSIPQLMKTMADVIGVTFYLSVDGIKTVLLVPTTNRSAAGCLAGAAGQSEELKEGEAKVDTEIMGKIADEMTKLARRMDGGIDQINQDMAPCGMEITDIFGGLDDLAPVIDVIAEIFQNLDWSGAEALGEELETIAQRPSVVPSVSRVFPSAFKDAIRSFAPSLDGPDPDSPGEQLWRRWPRFRATGPLAMGAPNERIIGIRKSGQFQLDEDGNADVTLPIIHNPAELKYRFIKDAGITNVTVETNAAGEIISTSTTWGDELSKVTYLSLQDIESKPDDNKFIYANKLSGPIILSGGDYNFESELYNNLDLKNNLGEVAREHAEKWDLKNPAQTAFAGMVADSIKEYLYTLGGGSVDRDVWAVYVNHLQDSYHPAALAGMAQGFTRYALQYGRFSENRISEVLLKPNNSNCDPADPSKVGDLMDMAGIVKDVQDEYNESACNDEMSMEETVNKCILFGTMLLFFQISITKFYLQNISILSAFKLDEIMGSNLVRDFITTTTFNLVDKFMNPTRFSPQMAQTRPDFSVLFRQEVNAWMDRKLKRGTGLEGDALRAIGVDPSASNLPDIMQKPGNAIKYMIAWRMKRCARPIANVIANPDAMSLENVFLKKIIGFAAPFSSQLEGTVSSAGVVALHEAGQDSFKLYVNDRVTNIENLFGYGGFKLEPWLHWESATTPDNEPVEMSIPNSFGAWDPALVAFSDDNWVEKKLTFSSGPGKAPVELLEAAESLFLPPAGLSAMGAVATEQLSYALLEEATLQAELNRAQGIPSTPTINLSGITLIGAKVKYRLVYYPPLESEQTSLNAHYNYDDTFLDKYLTLTALYGDLNLANGAEAAGPDEELGTEDDSYLNTWASALKNTINGEEAFIPLSLSGNPTISTSAAGEDIGTPWTPYWPFVDADISKTGQGCDPLSRGPAGELVQGQPPPLFEAGTGYPDRLDWELGGCIEQPFPDEVLEDGFVWSWQKYPCPVHGSLWAYGTAGDDPMNDPTATYNFPTSYPNPQAEDPTAFNTGNFKRDDPCGEWIQQPLEEFIAEAGSLVLKKDFITTSIPIMELESEALGTNGVVDFGAVNTYWEEGGDYLEISQKSVLQADLPGWWAIKDSPDYPKFEYFFSKIINKDSVFEAVLMNNFCQTELKFSKGMTDLFSDTLNGAAGLFITTLEIGAMQSGTTDDHGVLVPNGQTAPGEAPPYINIRSYILKALREMPLHILKGLCEVLDPHVIVTKIIKDISGQVINQSIDAMEMGLTIAEETSPEPIATILKALEVNPEAFVQFAFCELNKAMRNSIDDKASETDECKKFGDFGNADPFNEMSPFPTFTLKGVNFTGTIPGIFMMPPGPFGIVYLILRAILEAINLDPDDQTAPENSSCE